MSVDRKGGVVNSTAEFAQTVDKITIVGAVVGGAIGLFPPAFVLAAIGYSVGTYVIAEGVKS